LLDVSKTVTWADAAQVIVSILGFCLVLYQIRQLIKNIRGSAHDSLYAHYTDISKLFMDKPYLYPYFYYNKDPGRLAHTANENNEVDIMSEMLLGLIEHATLEQKNLPFNAWSECWKPYALARMRTSGELRRYFDENKDWYTEQLRLLLKDYEIDATSEKPNEARFILHRAWAWVREPRSA
jgi:hypothetical protein